MNDGLIVNNQLYQMDEYELSIVIPVYNNERFLKFCLDSVLLYQDLSKDLYEVIIVNDGSTDNSLNIMKTYASNYNNLTIIHQKNSGVSVARNKGMEIASGKYIWFVDGDDFVKANCLELVLKNLKTIIDVYHFSGYAFDQKDFDKNMAFCDYCGTSQPDIWTYIFSLKFLKDNKILFEEDIRYSETQLFINDVKLHKPKLLKDSNTLYYYRKNSYSVTATNRQRKIDGYFDYFDLLEKRFENTDYPIENTLGLIESVLRMRFLYAMEDMSIVTPEQFERGRVLSKCLYEYIQKHEIPNQLKYAFEDYKKLSRYCLSEKWVKILFRWRKNYYRKNSLKKFIHHPRKTIKKKIGIL